MQWMQQLDIVSKIILWIYHFGMYNNKLPIASLSQRTFNCNISIFGGAEIYIFIYITI